MTSQTVSFTPRPTLSPEVQAFARERGVEPYLPAIIEHTRGIFPAASSCVMLLEGDPEIADDWHIVFRLTVPLDVTQSLAADRQWIEGLTRVCPKELAWVFRLSLDLEP